MSFVCFLFEKFPSFGNWNKFGWNTEMEWRGGMWGVGGIGGALQLSALHFPAFLKSIIIITVNVEFSTQCTTYLFLYFLVVGWICSSNFYKWLFTWTTIFCNADNGKGWRGGEVALLWGTTLPADDREWPRWPKEPQLPPFHLPLLLLQLSREQSQVFHFSFFDNFNLKRGKML